MKITRAVTVCVLACFFTVCPYRAQAAVTYEVRNVVDEVVRIVADREMKKPQNDQRRRKALKKTIALIFDFEEMARRSMGSRWK